MKVAVVGTGFISNLIAPKIGAWGFDVTHVVSTPRSVAKAQALAGRLGASAGSDYGAALAADDVDAVYLGIPNDEHHDYALRALAAGKHVILEKPMASNYREAKELVDAAAERKLLLFDATTTFYQPSYKKVAEWLPRVGDVRLAVANYSQYSSRFDRFQRGDVAPAFDPAHAGGALMDLGHYCVSWLVGLLGEPQRTTYLANVSRGIDTSGVALLDYGSFKASAICAKDCDAPSYEIVQGTKGYIAVRDKPNGSGSVELVLHDGTRETYEPPVQDQYQGEFEALRGFAEDGEQGRLRCLEMARLGLLVSRVETEARRSADIVFAAD